MADAFFFEVDRMGRPPWDIGRTQPAFLELASDDIREARFSTLFPRIRAHAWLATLVREDSPPPHAAREPRATPPKPAARPPNLPLAAR